MHRSSIVRGRRAGSRVIEGMIRRRQALWVIAHQVGHDHADSTLLVIEHDRLATGCAGTQLQWAVRVFPVEGLTVQTIEIVDFQVTMIKKHHMGGVLSRYTFTDGTVTCVVIDRIII